MLNLSHQRVTLRSSLNSYNFFQSQNAIVTMTVTESDITKQALKTAVAQVCLAIGWNSIHQTPLNILVDILHK